MKKNKNDIYINNKIPKTDKKLNKYKRNIKLEFKGNAYITENNGLTLNEKLKSGDKITKNGEYLIKFINENGKVEFIRIKIQKFNFLFCFLILIFLLVVFLFIFKPYVDIDKQILFETLGFDYQFTGNRYVFNIGYGKENYKEVTLRDNVSNSLKIFPGCSGKFELYISTLGGNKDISYKMNIKEENNKPQNLKYKIGEKEYSSMNEVAKSFAGTIKENTIKKVIIEWYWDFYSDDDAIDTFDGSNFDNYSFLMSITGV